MIIAIKNNDHFSTDNLPATCSRKIVTDLLKDSLGFNGLVVTDALNMGGVVNVPNCGLKAIKAGCDMLLHCNGDMAEMKAVAEGAARLDGKRLERADAAAAARGTIEEFDPQDAESRLNALLEPVTG